MLRGPAYPTTTFTGLQNMVIHLVDGTYELFRHFYGLRRFTKGKDRPYGGVVGVLQTVIQMLEKGATHIGVATDHVIESFRNDLWPDYKTGEGIDPALWAQFHPLEDALGAMGVVVWPMVELEADDALASAANIAARSRRVDKVCIWTVDKDLAQCVQGDRVVQMDRRANKMLDADAVRAKYGVVPALIPDYLALVGDAADGYPGISGIGRGHRGPHAQSIWTDRSVSGKRARRSAQAGIVVQEARDARVRCETVPQRGRTALARTHGCIRRVGRSLGGAAPPRALPEGTGVHAVMRARTANSKAHSLEV